MAQKLVKFIEIEEFRKVLAAEKNRELKLAYSLAFGSGLRISEIVGYNKIKPLQEGQIDLERHQIKILGKRDKERITVTSPWLNKTNIKLLPLQVTRRTLQRRFTNLCKNVLGRKLNFHTLRHGFGNYMANEKGVPLPMVQQMLGHSRLDTTGIYTKANPIKTIERAWEVF